MYRSFVIAAVTVSVGVLTAHAADPVFSGPQIGEKLPPLKVKGVYGSHVDQDVDLIDTAGDKPVLIFFIHERTRPAFGLMRSIMQYAGNRKSDGLLSATVFLTGDATATLKWLNVVERYFPPNVEIGISPDGQEGPGAYGLNRNVTVTALVGKGGKVTANFALVQPSVQADGPKILKAIVEAIGSGEVPDIASLAGARYQDAPQRNMTPEDDPNLRPLLRDLLNKEASAEQVAAAAKKVEEYVAKHKAAAQQLGRITNTVVNSDRFETYGDSRSS